MQGMSGNTMNHHCVLACAHVRRDTLVPLRDLIALSVTNPNQGVTLLNDHFPNRNLQHEYTLVSHLVCEIGSIQETISGR